MKSCMARIAFKYEETRATHNALSPSGFKEVKLQDNFPWAKSEFTLFWEWGPVISVVIQVKSGKKKVCVSSSPHPRISFMTFLRDSGIWVVFCRLPMPRQLLSLHTECLTNTHPANGGEDIFVWKVANTITAQSEEENYQPTRQLKCWGMLTKR